MTWTDPIDVLADLIRHVPVHVIDVPVARRAGDTAAVAYASAMAAWRREAALALAEAEDGSPPDAFNRIATASALTQQQAAE
jgi:hypothetical protein